MSGPSVVVERAPDGWTHIGGPGMHLLIGLDEDDDRTLAASDAADGGDIDDVVEVLTTGGMRKAHHFVGVHWQPRTRIVAFGPVAALVTLADGSEHDVRATSARVWTDLELPEHPEQVVLRVLDESERSQPVPPQHLAAGVPAGSPVSDVTFAGAAASDDARTGETTAEGDSANRTPAIPTFGAASTTDSPVPAAGSGSSPWGRSWARRDETLSSASASVAAVAGSSSAPDGPDQTESESAARQEDPPVTPAASRPAPAAENPAPTPTTAAPALRPWGSVSPAVPVRAEVVPPAAQRDVDSTWAARPVPEADRAATRAPVRDEGVT
ncbi:MAG: hypothetical protein HOQ27_00810, partial [Dermatophilaceae bacterium]|nr:hypothetical protein [Dermatophilaceae bacterium]